MTAGPSTTPGRWQVPEPVATCAVETAAGARIVVRRHGNPDGPRIVLSHGNGLASDSYYPFWSLLEDRFDLILFDFRNHGWNPPSPDGHRNHNIATFVADAEVVSEGIAGSFGEKPKVGVFHSVSAVTALHQRTPGEGYAALVLFDPPVYLAGADASATDTLWREFALKTRLRDERYESREEFIRAVRRSRVFARLLPGVPELLARTTLRPAANGDGFEVCCPRECEALVYEYVFAYGLEFSAEDFACPVKVIAGDPTLYSFLPSRDQRRLFGVDYDFVPDTTHFLQLENPAACVALMLEFLEGHGLV